MYFSNDDDLLTLLWEGATSGHTRTAQTRISLPTSLCHGLAAPSTHLFLLFPLCHLIFGVFSPVGHCRFRLSLQELSRAISVPGRCNRRFFRAFSFSFAFPGEGPSDHDSFCAIHHVRAEFIIVGSTNF